jgi:hypothetical protein
MRSTRSLPPFSRLAGLLVLGAALLGACGSPSRPSEVTAGQDPTVQGTADTALAPVGPVAPAPGGGALPTLPPIDDRHPEQFTAEGCAATSEGADCGTRSADIDRTQAGDDEHDWRVLAGFVGTRWSTTPTGTVDVLTDTVTSPTSGVWWARGLVRNGTAAPAAGLVVRATLLDASGGELAVVEAQPTLPVVRAGEPVPFEVVADEVAAEQVHQVVWSADAGAATLAPVRDVEWATFWQRPADDPRPVDTYLFVDPADGTHPHVVFGGATLTGTATVDALVVVGAWMDPSGRIVAVEEGIVSEIDAAGLAPGSSVDVVLAADGVPADAQLLVWVSAP